MIHHGKKSHGRGVFCEYCDEAMKEFAQDMKNHGGGNHLSNECVTCEMETKRQARMMTTQNQGVRELLADTISTDSHGEMIINWETALKKADAIIELIERDVIGEDEDANEPKGERFEDERISKEDRNSLRAEQRARLKGGKV